MRWSAKMATYSRDDNVVKTKKVQNKNKHARTNRGKTDESPTYCIQVSSTLPQTSRFNLKEVGYFSVQ